jgi:hypothetical protein
VVTTLAGLAGAPGNTNGNGSAARFHFPAALAVGPTGDIFVADLYHSLVRKVTPSGQVSTFATLPIYFLNFSEVPAGPEGLTVDSFGNVFVAATNVSAILKITPAGQVSTFAGNPGSRGSTNGTGTAARFNRPSGIAVDSSDNLYVADTFNNRLRKITSAAVVSTLPTTQLTRTRGVAVDGLGNVYCSATFDGTVRKLTPSGVLTTLGGLAGQAQSSDGLGSAARLWTPVGLAVDSEGKVYVADSRNNTIRVGSPFSAVSRKLHDGAAYDLDLPLTGAEAVESRSGGANDEYQIIVNCHLPATFASATVTDGQGTLGQTTGNGSSTIVLNLSGVASGQRLAITLSGLNDGSTTRDLVIPIGVLVGDVNGDRTVNAGDALQTRSRSGQPLDETNFRFDVNLDRGLNSGDAIVVRARSGSSIGGTSSD